MTYMVLRGEFVIRYPDLPRQGPEPDGDTVKFRPDSPALVEALPRPSGTPPDLSARGISVRLEAIDALETHFGETHQELAGANAARDELLRRARLHQRRVLRGPAQQGPLGRPGHVRGPRAVQRRRRQRPADRRSSTPATTPARRCHRLRRRDPRRRVGERRAAGGRPRLPGVLRHPAGHPARPPGDPLAGRPRRPSRRWACGPGRPPTPTAPPPSPTSPPSSSWRCGPSCSAASCPTWPPAPRLRRPRRLAPGRPGAPRRRAVPPRPLERANIHDVMRASGPNIQLTVWPEDFIISPDPALPGTPTGGSTAGVGDVADPGGPGRPGRAPTATTSWSPCSTPRRPRST